MAHVNEQDKPRLTILTAGYMNARRLAYLMTRLGIRFDIITIAFRLPTRRDSGLVAHWRKLAWAKVRSIGLLRQIAQCRWPPFPVKPIYGGVCNGSRMLRALKQLRPDYLILMGTGILSAEALGIAAKGVLNLHPGLLPWIRGVDTVYHTMTRNVAIGVTGHFVDVGVDTGPAITRFLLPVSPGDRLSEIRNRLDHLSVAAMLELIQQAWAGRPLEARPHQEEHALCRHMAPEQIAAAQQLINEGRAWQLYNQWLDGGQGITDGADILARYGQLWPDGRLW